MRQRCVGNTKKQQTGQGDIKYKTISNVDKVLVNKPSAPECNA
jgi:hypothetical protein